MSKQPRASRISGWQPIGLATPLTTNEDPRVFLHDLSLARARRTARALVTPGVVLAATLGMASTAAAHNGTLHTPSGDIPVAQATPAQILAYGDPDTPASSTDVMTTTSTGTTSTTTSAETTDTTTSTTSSPLSGLGGGELPGSDLPVVGKFIANAPKIFSGGLLGGKDAVQTSVPRPEHTEGEHTQGGDACDFFLEHMWKNEDGIPVIGTNTHFLTYHTDAEYENLILSLFSGAIGNSQMPIIDVYGGPLGWIPIFNPSHVEGHGTDYATMLTGCGGMGLPIDIKTGEVNLDRVPTPEKVLAFAEKIMPTVPNPQKILASDYLYNTLAVDEITNRLGFNTVFTPDEYLNFATNNFDAFRLLWQTALEKFNGGDPTAILEILQVTDNLKTLESLGLPGFSTLLGGVVPQAGSTETVTIGGKTYPVTADKVTVDGETYPVIDGKVTIDGQTHDVEATDSTGPGGLTGSLPLTDSLPLEELTGGIPVLDGVLGGGSSPTSGLPIIGDLLGGSTPADGNDGTDGTDDTDEPGDSPTSGLPIVGDLLGGSSPTSGLPIIGDLLGGGSTTAPAPNDGTDGTDGTPGTPGTDGTDEPGDSPTAELPIVGDLLGGSSPTSGLPIIGDLLGGGSTTAPAPNDGTDGTDGTPGTPGTDGTDEPGDSPTAGLPIVGELLGGSSSPIAGLPVVGDLLGGGSTTAPAPNDGTDGTDGTPGTPGTDGTDGTPGTPGTPGTDGTDSTDGTPGTDGTPSTPGSPAPGTGGTPGTGGNSPIDSPQGTVAFNVGAAKVNGQTSPNAPGVTVPTGNQVTFTVPVTNTGDLPLTTLVGKASDGGTMTGARLPLAPGQTTTLTYTTTAKPGTQALSFGIVGSNPNGQQQGKTCSAVYTSDVQNGEIATTGALEVDDRATNDAVRYTFHSTDVSKLDVQVTNNGDAPLQNVTASSPAGPVTGGKTTLQPGESTWFSVQIAPKSGINTVPVNFTGTDPTGKVTTAQERFEYTLCTCAATTAPSQA